MDEREVFKLMWWLCLFIITIIGCSCEEHPIPSEKWNSPFTLLWSYEYNWVGSTQVSSALPLGDSLVFMSAGREVWMLKQETGEIKWKTHVDDNTNIQSEIFITDNKRIFASHVEDIRAFDIETGEQVWQTELPYSERGGFWDDEISYYNEKIFAGGRWNIFCLNSLSGEIVWKKTPPGNPLHTNIWDDKLLLDVDHKVYNSQDQDTSTVGWVYALNLDTGDSLWRIEVNSGIGAIRMAPVIENDIMYIGTSWRKPFGVQAFDLNTREELWHYQWPNAEFIVDHGIIVDDVLILSLAWDAIGGWDKNTGERLWVTYPTQNYNWSRIGYDGRYIYYAHGWKLHVIEPTTGEILYSTYGPNGEYVYTIAVTDKRIFINGWPRNMCWTTYDPSWEKE